jgi:hypothetical protein
MDMPVDFRWDDAEKTILIQKYYGSVSITDYMEAVKQTSEWLAQVTHPVDLVLDILDARINWGGLITGASYADQRVPENQRLIVIVGTNPFIRAMTEIARRVAPKANRNQFFASSLDNARLLIRMHREQLSHN